MITLKKSLKMMMIMMIMMMMMMMMTTIRTYQQQNFLKMVPSKTGIKATKEKRSSQSTRPRSRCSRLRLTLASGHSWSRSISNN